MPKSLVLVRHVSQIRRHRQFTMASYDETLARSQSATVYHSAHELVVMQLQEIPNFELKR